MRKILVIIGLVAIAFFYVVNQISFKGGPNLSGSVHLGSYDPSYEFCTNYIEFKGHILDFSLNHSQEESVEFARKFKSPNSVVTKIAHTADQSWISKERIFEMSNAEKKDILLSMQTNYHNVVQSCVSEWAYNGFVSYFYKKVASN